MKTLQQINDKIKKHKKFKTLSQIQKERIAIAAAWVKFMVNSPVFKRNREDCLTIARNHKNHIEFDGILLDVILSISKPKDTNKQPWTSNLKEIEGRMIKGGLLKGRTIGL